MNRETVLPSLVVLLLLACLLFFLQLGTLGLTDRDEGSNAEAAREMVETGDWVTPTLNYEPRFAKPVFTYWVVSGAYLLFGVSEFSARFPSALFGVLLVLLQYLLLARVWDSRVGLLGGLMLLLNIEILAIGRLVLTDSILIFFTTLSLYGFWLGFHGKRHERHYLWCFYVGMGIAFLTKGPVGMLVPLLAVVPYLTITRRWRQFWQYGHPVAGLSLFVLVALPWYAAMFAIHDASYAASAQANTIGRFLSTIGGHGFTFLFYIPILFFGFFPWSAFLPGAFYMTWQTWRAARRAQTTQGLPSPTRSDAISDELDLFAAGWLLGVLFFFTLSASRLPHYIGPLYPAAAILAASYWSRCLEHGTVPWIRASFHTLMGLGYALGFAFTLTPILYSKFLDQVTKEFPMGAEVEPGPIPIVVGLVLIIGVTVTVILGLSDQRRGGAFWAAGATIVLALLLAMQVGIPHFSRSFVEPPQTLAHTAGLNLKPEDRLILYGPSRPALIFYARRKVIMVDPGREETMRAYLTQPGRTMILLQSRLQPNLPEEAADFSLLLKSGGYSLLANEPMVK